MPISRWPVPGEARVVALMGGTFDPVHRAHVELGLAAREAVGASWLVFMPAGRNPLKASGPTLGDRTRVRLLALALEGIERVGVSTLELEDSGPSYTVDTLRQLKVLAPGTELRLVMGGDAARSFHLWREAREVLRLSTPAVVLRPPDETVEDLSRGLAGHWNEQEVRSWESWVVAAPVMRVSATRVRELLGRGAWEDPELAASLHPRVLEELRRSGQGGG